MAFVILRDYDNWGGRHRHLVNCRGHHPLVPEKCGLPKLLRQKDSLGYYGCSSLCNFKIRCLGTKTKHGKEPFFFFSGTVFRQQHRGQVYSWKHKQQCHHHSGLGMETLPCGQSHKLRMRAENSIQSQDGWENHPPCQQPWKKWQKDWLTMVCLLVALRVQGSCPQEPTVGP